MKTIFRIATLGLVTALTACGSDAAPGPTEQIIVREPGDTPAATLTKAPEVMSLAAAGEAAFAVCSACHAVEKGAPAGPGPNLHGVVGRAAGAADGFAYSEALKTSGISWTDAELDAYLANPVAKVPGTTMVAGALEDAEQRKAVIAYLKDASSS